MENSTKIAIVVFLVLSSGFVLYYNRPYLPSSLQEFLHYNLVRYNPLGGPVVFEGRGGNEEQPYHSLEPPYLSARLLCNTHRDAGKTMWFCKGNHDVAEVLHIRNVRVFGIVSGETHPVEDYQVEIELDVSSGHGDKAEEVTIVVQGDKDGGPTSVGAKPSSEHGCESHWRRRVIIDGNSTNDVPKEFVPSIMKQSDRMCDQCPACRGDMRPSCQCHLSSPPPPPNWSQYDSRQGSSGCCCCCKECRGEVMATESITASPDRDSPAQQPLPPPSHASSSPPAPTEEESWWWAWGKWTLWVLWKMLPYLIIAGLIGYLFISGKADNLPLAGRSFLSTKKESSTENLYVPGSPKPPTEDTTPTTTDQATPGTEDKTPDGTSGTTGSKGKVEEVRAPMMSRNDTTVHSSGYKNIIAGKLSPTQSLFETRKSASRERVNRKAVEARTEITSISSRSISSYQPANASPSGGNFFAEGSPFPSGKGGGSDTVASFSTMPARNYAVGARVITKEQSAGRNDDRKKGADLQVNVTPSVFSGTSLPVHYSIKLEDEKEREKTPKLNDESGCMLASSRKEKNNFQMNKLRKYK